MMFGSFQMPRQVTLGFVLFLLMTTNVHSFSLITTTQSTSYHPLFRRQHILYGSNIPGNEEEMRAALREKQMVPQTSSKETLESFVEVDDATMSVLKSKRPYLSIILERALQTLDDFQLAKKVKGVTKRDIDPSITREKIVVLGSGWGSHSFLKTIDAVKYDVTVVSPRNHFLFTPMLAASAIGTVDFRSIIEPIRNVNPLVNFVEATCDDIDVDKKTLSCQSVFCEGTACDITDFKLDYDHLIVGVGASVNTFGIKGVQEYCQFLKQIEDASKLRKTIAYCFERANVPGLSEEEIRDALSFVIVGAGPTGVEFTSELRDWVEREGKKYYGGLLKYVSITLIEAGKAILMVFEKSMQDEGLRQITTRTTSLIEEGYIDKETTNVLLNIGVQEINEKTIKLSNGESMPYGFCLWAAGNGPIPLILDTVNKIQEQKDMQSSARGRLVIDQWLRVKGAPQIYGIGDCTFMDENSLPATAQVASQQGSYLGRLFSKGYVLNNEVPLKQERSSISSSTDGNSKSINMGDEENKNRVANNVEAASDSEGDVGISAKNNEWVGVKSSTSNIYDEEIEYISERFAGGKQGLGLKGKRGIEYAKPFQFLNLGVLAYVGGSTALAQIDVDDRKVFGQGQAGFLLWRGIYWFKQVNRGFFSFFAYG